MRHELVSKACNKRRQKALVCRTLCQCSPQCPVARRKASLWQSLRQSLWPTRSSTQSTRKSSSSRSRRSPRPEGHPMDLTCQGCVSWARRRFWRSFQEPSQRPRAEHSRRFERRTRTMAQAHVDVSCRRTTRAPTLLQLLLRSLCIACRHAGSARPFQASAWLTLAVCMLQLTSICATHRTMCPGARDGARADQST